MQVTTRNTGARAIVASGLMLACAAGAARSDIELLGTAAIAFDARDHSGLDNLVGDKIPHDRLGSFGSAIDYTGADDLYVCADDRGPGDGATAFRPRVQTFKIVIEPGTDAPVRVELVKTTLLTSNDGGELWGYAGGYDRREQRKGVRFDAEGLRVLGDGSMWISDEYGPWVDRFAFNGRRVERLRIPAKFGIAQPGNAEEEMPPGNSSGRQSNRGFEGLALLPSGKVVAMLQSPLIQDNALSKNSKRVGFNIRMLEIEPNTNISREWVYQLEDEKNGVNEVLAVSETTMIVLERDGKGGNEAERRGLYLIDTAGASDVSLIDELPRQALQPETKPVKKRLLLDFMDTKYGLAGPKMPEKIEGLTFGPTLKDGRRTLIVTTDNDFRTDQDSWFWVFAVDAADLVFGTQK